MWPPLASTERTTGTCHSSALARNRGIRPCETVNATSKIGSAEDTWLMASSAPPVRGMCSPPDHPIRVPNIVHGHSIQIANPNQKPDPRRRREKVSAIFSRTVSGRVAVTGSSSAGCTVRSARRPARRSCPAVAGAQTVRPAV